MSFWDDLVRTFTGQPAKSTGRQTTIKPAASPLRSTGGGGGGGLASFSTPVPRNDWGPKEPEPWSGFTRPSNEFRTHQGPREYRETPREQAVEVERPKGNSFDNKTKNTPGNVFEEMGNLLSGVFGTTENNAFTRREDGDLGMAPGLWSNSMVGPTRTATPTDPAARVEKDDYLASLTQVSTTERELTPEEWSALTPEQQKGVISSWALYQASKEDAALEANAAKDEYFDTDVASLFGEDGGSDKYAPNTLRVLQELGYANQQGDIDNFLDGTAIPTYEDILAKSGNKPRQEISTALSSSAAYNGEDIAASLSAGKDLLDSLRVSASTPELTRFGGVLNPAYSSLADTDLEDLSALLNNMTHKPTFERMTQDPELYERITSAINEVNSQYGEDTVAQYFRDNVSAFANPEYMNENEFMQYWMEQ